MISAAAYGSRRSPGRHRVFPRHGLPELCNFVVPLSDRGRRESRALTAPAASGPKQRQDTRIVTTGSAGTTRLSPRNGVTASFVLSPVKRPFLPPSLHGTYQQL